MIKQPRDLDGMVVAITGASAGIGRALASALAGAGARLVLGARRLELLEALNGELGGGHLCVRTDVAKPEDCAAFVAAAHARFGRLDTLVCNAGFAFLRSIADTSAAEWRELLAINLGGTTECVRAALPLMLAQERRQGCRGQILVVSSCLARRALPDLGAYAATKAAQLSLVEALRVELAGTGVVASAMLPVGTDTDFKAVAQERSTRTMLPPGRFEIRQSAATVAACMVRGIVHPVPELWSHAPSRWVAALATCVPGLADRVLGRVRRLVAH